MSYSCRNSHWSPFLHSPRSQCLQTTVFSPLMCRNGHMPPVEGWWGKEKGKKNNYNVSHRATATPLQEGFQKTSPVILALSDKSKIGSSKIVLWYPLMSFTTKSPALNPGNYKPQQLRGRSTAKHACGEFTPSFNSSFAYLLLSSLKKKYFPIAPDIPISFSLPSISLAKQKHCKQWWKICFHLSILCK